MLLYTWNENFRHNNNAIYVLIVCVCVCGTKQKHQNYRYPWYNNDMKFFNPSIISRKKMRFKLGDWFDSLSLINNNNTHTHHLYIDCWLLIIHYYYIIIIIMQWKKNTHIQPKNKMLSPNDEIYIQEYSKFFFEKIFCLFLIFFSLFVIKLF